MKVNTVCTYVDAKASVLHAITPSQLPMTAGPIAPRQQGTCSYQLITMHLILSSFSVAAASESAFYAAHKTEMFVQIRIDIFTCISHALVHLDDMHCCEINGPCIVDSS